MKIQSDCFNSMGGAIHQLWSLGLVKSSEEKESLLKEHSRDPSWKGNSAFPPQSQHKVSKGIDTCSNPSWVNENIQRRGPAVSTRAPHVDAHEKIIHNHAPPCKDERIALIASLRACAKNKDLRRGTQLHEDILKKGLLEKCSDALVTMYAKCGALAKAKELLDMHKSKRVFAWTALISEYTTQGQGQDALDYFERMQCEGISPDAVTYACVLKACGTIKAANKGEQIYNQIAKQGMLKNDVVLCTALVDMYSKCGAFAKARRVLEEFSSQNVASWNALITGYAQQGQGQQALNCFEQMQQEDVSPDAVTFSCILKACGSIGAVDKGEQIHEEIVRQGLLGNDVVLGNALVDMYVKCGFLTKAQGVLEKLHSRNVVSWNALIAKYAQLGHGEKIMKCSDWMQCKGLSPDAVTFVYILKACGSIKRAEKGEQIHDEIVRQGLLENNIVLGNAIVDMYAKCGELMKALKVFEELPSRHVVSWNILIGGYAQWDQGEQALNCFKQMQREGFSPDAVTFACTLKACGTIGAADEGEEIHDAIVRQGLLENNIILGTALVDMYAKCGALVKAREVLEALSSRDVVSWNALITGYVQKGQSELALDCFERMQHEGPSPNEVTFACILKACGTIGSIDKVEEIHMEMVRQGLLGNGIMLGTALVDMYAKCGALEKARRVLQELPCRDVVSWSALIAGYAQEGQGEHALNCYEWMQREGLCPDAVTFACILKACGTIGAADKGEKIHDEIAKQGLLENNIVLGTALVDMYAKCGALKQARQVLEELPFRNVASWNALIAGYAHQGQGEQALDCFDRMQCEGFSPDAVTFGCVLNVCNHLGLVEDGHMYFLNMSTKFGIKPALDHYTCMVALFGRAGHLDKAARVIQEMPLSDYSVVWSAVLGACRKWGDVNVGRWAFEQAVQVDKGDTAAYVLMANIYAAAGMHEDAEKIEAMRKENSQ